MEWTVDKQKYIYQMTPQEYNKYISDYMVAIENSHRQYGFNSVESCEKVKKATKDYMSNYKKMFLKDNISTKQHKKLNNIKTVPGEMRRELLLERAKELLISTDKSVEYISNLLKFSSSSYFRKNFKNHFGITPREMRKRNPI